MKLGNLCPRVLPAPLALSSQLAAFSASSVCWRTVWQKWGVNGPQEAGARRTTRHRYRRQMGRLSLACVPSDLLRLLKEAREVDQPHITDADSEALKLPGEGSGPESDL